MDLAVNIRSFAVQLDRSSIRFPSELYFNRPLRIRFPEASDVGQPDGVFDWKIHRPG